MGPPSGQVFRKIKLPLLTPITSFIIMMGIINCLKVFTEVNIMTPDGGPLELDPPHGQSYIYDQSFTRGKMGRGRRRRPLLLFFVIFAFTLLQRAFGKQERELRVR